MPLFDLMNHSINQTLSRTVLTVLTVMLAAASLYFLGGKVIHDFALAMLIGVGFGTYSSVFVASALSLDIDNWRQKRIKEKAAAARGGGRGQEGGPPRHRRFQVGRPPSDRTRFRGRTAGGRAVRKMSPVASGGGASTFGVGASAFLVPPRGTDYNVRKTWRPGSGESI